MEIKVGNKHILFQGIESIHRDDEIGTIIITTMSGKEYESDRVYSEEKAEEIIAGIMQNMAISQIL